MQICDKCGKEFDCDTDYEQHLMLEAALEAVRNQNQNELPGLLSNIAFHMQMRNVLMVYTTQHISFEDAVEVWAKQFDYFKKKTQELHQKEQDEQNSKLKEIKDNLPGH